MEKKLQAFLDQAFAPYGDFPARADVTKELLANLTEKFSDLKAQGLSDDDAYRSTVESFGDVSEIMDQLPHGAAAENGSREDSTSFKDLKGLRKAIKETLKRTGHGLSRFAATDMRQADLSDSNLVDSDFSFSALQGISFDRSDLTKARFRAAALKEATFVGANLTAAVFASADVQSVSFKDANLTQTAFKTSALRNVSFDNTTLNQTYFALSDLGGVAFDNQTLQGVLFERSNLKKATFKNATLRDVTFHQSDVKEAVFAGATMDKVTFALLKSAKADLDGVNVA